MPRNVAPRAQQPAIAIIGAGFAGLRCADILLQHGFAVTIFEARDRLGGRVAQSHELGHVVDLGPNWIHGAGDNPILRIAKETDTTLHELDEEQAVFAADDTRLTAEQAGEYGLLLWDDGGLIPQAFEYSTEHTHSIDSGRSLYDYFEEKVASLFTDLDDGLGKQKRETLLQVCQMWGAYVGSDVRRQSLKFFWLEKTVEGDNPFVAGTYAKILKHIVRAAQESADIRLSQPVVRIFTAEREQAGARGSVTVETQSGSKEEFDDVVVTVPLGYLKRHHKTVFYPPLATDLQSSIEALGYGNLDKVYITFDRAWWDDGEGDAKHYPGFSHWLSPTHDAITGQPLWDQQAMNLAALPSNSAHPTLLFYVYGDCARQIAEMVMSETDAQRRTQQLIDFFMPCIRCLPNYRLKDAGCQPTGALATAWTSDELAGYGSYSNFQVGLEQGDKDIERIRQGCPERHLWFAGEHTSPFDALGTTTGAYLSGEQVAASIAARYEVDS